MHALKETNSVEAAFCVTSLGTKRVGPTRRITCLKLISNSDENLDKTGTLVATKRRKRK